MDVLAMLGIAIILVALMWLYGELRYAEGADYGKVHGVLTGAALIMQLFEKRKVLQVDSIGNIYRITDTGNRGETIVSRDEIDFIKNVDFE